MDEAVTAESEPKTVLESVRVTGDFAILRLPDLDGRPIYFSSFGVARETGWGWLGKRHEVLKDIGDPEMVIKGRLDKGQKERLTYALEELKLPTLLAVHAALNTDIDLAGLPKPTRDTPAPVCLGMPGRPGVGKSFMTAMLAVKEGYPILNFDPVSGTEAAVYKDYFEKQCTPEERKYLSVEKGWKMAREVKGRMGSNRSRNPKTFRDMLDEALNKVTATADRPALFICDMPGVPGEYDFGTGRVHGRKRAHHVIDLAAWEACESGILSTHQLMDVTMEHKLTWIKDEVIGKHFPVWREMRQEFVEGVRNLEVQ